MANDIAKKADSSLTLFGDDAKGFDNMTQEDLALPYVRILGQLSPQVTQGLSLIHISEPTRPY